MNYHKDVMAVLMAEFGNLQAAWQWGVEHGQMEMARDMALSLFFISEMLGWYHFAIQSVCPDHCHAEHDHRRAGDAARTTQRRTCRPRLARIRTMRPFQSLTWGWSNSPRRQRSAATRWRAAWRQAMPAPNCCC